MVATEFLGYINSFKATSFLGVEDLADRANFQWNVIVILICMILVTVRQYFMAPLVCYFPTTVSGTNPEQYVVNLCWVEGTYPFNLSSGAVPHDIASWENMKDKQLSYYQWVPLMLGLQAIMFYLPRVMWNIYMYNRTGADLENLVTMAHKASQTDKDSRSKTVKHIANTLQLLLFNRREYKDKRSHVSYTTWSIIQALPGKRHGNRLLYSYLAVKVIYVLISIAQLALMYHFLRFDAHEGYMWFGLRVLQNIASGQAWMETQVFPRIGICRQPLQHVGSSNFLFAQCVLPINMLNEKIYIFLFFFISAIMFITLLSIPLWVFRMGFSRRQKHFIKRFLKIADVYNRDDPKMRQNIEHFVHDFLRADGQFLLRMLAMNAGDLITVEIVCCMFFQYEQKSETLDFRGPTAKRLEQARNDDLCNKYRKDQNGFVSVKLTHGGSALDPQKMPTAPVYNLNHYDSKMDFENGGPLEFDASRPRLDDTLGLNDLKKTSKL